MIGDRVYVEAMDGRGGTLENENMTTTKTPTGLHCNIYNSDLGNCSAGGISSRVKCVTLMDADNGPSEPTAEFPAVKLVRRRISGEDYIHAEPVEPCPSGACRMAGGTFIYSCDSRYREAVGHSYPVSLHDRHEFS